MRFAGERFEIRKTRIHPSDGSRGIRVRRVGLRQRPRRPVLFLGAEACQPAHQEHDRRAADSVRNRGVAVGVGVGNGRADRALRARIGNAFGRGHRAREPRGLGRADEAVGRSQRENRRVRRAFQRNVVLVGQSRGKTRSVSSNDYFAPKTVPRFRRFKSLRFRGTPSRRQNSINRRSTFVAQLQHV